VCRAYNSFNNPNSKVAKLCHTLGIVGSLVFIVIRRNVDQIALLGIIFAAPKLMVILSSLQIFDTSNPWLHQKNDNIKFVTHSRLHCARPIDLQLTVPYIFVIISLEHCSIEQC
jgi:hypothetical protein